MGEKMTPIESIYKEPEKWRTTKHRFMHEDGFNIWIANGFWFCATGNGGNTGLIRKISKQCQESVIYTEKRVTT